MNLIDGGSTAGKGGGVVVVQVDFEDEEEMK